MIGLLLALQACAGKPFGRDIPNPFRHPLPTYLQNMPAASSTANASESFAPLGAGQNVPGQNSSGQDVIQASHIGTPTVGGHRTFRDVTLSEVIQMALQNSTVIRDLEAGWSLSLVRPTAT